MKIIWELYTAFFRIGILTFGGGYAMLPMLQSEIVEKRKWATEEEVLNYFAVGQCTPGIIAVNTATFIGYKQKRIPGGVVATLGVISPSILIILIIARVLDHYAANPWVAHAFAGVRVAVCALVLSSIVKLWKSGIENKWGILLFLSAFVLVAFVELSSVWIVLGAIGIGICLQFLGGQRPKNADYEEAGGSK